MRRVLKWIGVILGVLIGLVLISALILYFVGGSTLNKTRQVQPQPVAVPVDDASLARGEHVVKLLCTSCHGADLSGTAILDDPTIGTIYAANISGLAQDHTDEQLVLAIRHGISHDGRQLAIMPSEAFINFSAEDLGAVIAYLKTVPRVGTEKPMPELTLMGQIMLGLGMFGQVFPAEYIDHDQPFPPMPPISASPEYGEYLARFCHSCHGEDLSGMQLSQPGAPIAPNLTPGGVLAGWTEAEFIQTLRTGVTPSGHQLDPEFMPWESFAKFDDEELQAMWLYLESLPALEMNLQ